MILFILNAIRSVFEREPEDDADKLADVEQVEKEGRGDKPSSSIDLEAIEATAKKQRIQDYNYELEDDWER